MKRKREMIAINYKQMFVVDNANERKEEFINISRAKRK
jgi:hypothetical protein